MVMVLNFISYYNRLIKLLNVWDFYINIMENIY